MTTMTKLTTKEFFIVACCGCNKVRTADMKWAEGNDLLSIVPHEYVSHTMCPSCAVKYYPEFVLKNKIGPTAS